MWDFPTYATKSGLKRKWLLEQDLSPALKSYVGELRDTASVDSFYEMTDAKGDTALNQTIHVHQQVEGSNNTIVGYQSGEASAHVENDRTGVAGGSNKRNFTHEEDTGVGAKRSRDGDSKADSLSISAHDSSTSTIESNQSELYAPSTGSMGNENAILRRDYVLDFYELYGQSSEAERHQLSVFATIPERLALSSIDYVDEQNTEEVTLLTAKAYFSTFKDLRPNVYKAIREWRRDMSQDKLYFQPSPTNLDEMIFYNILTHTPSRKWIIWPDTLSTYSRHYSPHDLRYKWNGILCHSRIKYVICVTNQRRSDMLFTSEYGIEVGNGELKPPGSNTALLDEDRARISELCKWQLHTRLKESRSEQECVTYGILIAGTYIELTALVFEKGRYTYGIIKTVTLPTMKSTYCNMEETLEVLASLKDAMEKSMSTYRPDDPFIFHEYRDLLRPTLAFVK